MRSTTSISISVKARSFTAFNFFNIIFMTSFLPYFDTLVIAWLHRSLQSRQQQ